MTLYEWLAVGGVLAGAAAVRPGARGHGVLVLLYLVALVNAAFIAVAVLAVSALYTPAAVCDIYRSLFPRLTRAVPDSRISAFDVVVHLAPLAILLDAAPHIVGLRREAPAWVWRGGLAAGVAIAAALDVAWYACVPHRMGDIYTRAVPDGVYRLVFVTVLLTGAVGLVAVTLL